MGMREIRDTEKLEFEFGRFLFFWFEIWDEGAERQKESGVQFFPPFFVCCGVWVC